MKTYYYNTVVCSYHDARTGDEATEDAVNKELYEKTAVFAGRFEYCYRVPVDGDMAKAREANVRGEAIETWRDPNGPAPAKALTYDDGKAPLAQLPWAAIEGLAMVQAYGHKKYKDFNNYRKGMEVSRNISCALRHCKEYMEGVDKDAESGRHPLEHALTRLAFVLQNIHDGTAVDDRFKAVQK